MGFAGEGRPLAVMDQRVVIARPDRRVHPVCKVARPVRLRRVWIAAVQAPQIVDEAARTHHQHALATQRRQRPPQRDVMRHAQMRLHRDLHHRNVMGRIHQQQRHPGAMIQATRRVDGGAGQRRHLVAERRIARRGIAQIVQRLREALKIMDGAVHGYLGDGGRGGFPVRRGDDDAARLFQRGAQAPQESARRNLIERQRRGAVRDEERRKHVAISGFLPPRAERRAGEGVTTRCRRRRPEL